MSDPPGKSSQTTPGNGPASKYRNERVRALGYLLATGADDLRSEEQLRRARRALRLEGETIDLLNRASRSFLACLGY